MKVGILLGKWCVSFVDGKSTTPIYIDTVHCAVEETEQQSTKGY